MTNKGLLYEPETRHIEVLAQSLGIEIADKHPPVTPGAKPSSPAEPNPVVDAEENVDDISASIKNINMHLPVVASHAAVDVHAIVLYSEVCGRHPSTVLANGPVDLSGVVNDYELTRPCMDVSTGLDQAAMRQRGANAIPTLPSKPVSGLRSFIMSALKAPRGRAGRLRSSRRSARRTRAGWVRRLLKRKRGCRTQENV